MSKGPKDYLFVLFQFVLFALFILKPDFITTRLDQVFTFTGSVLMGIGLVIGLLGIWQLRKKPSAFPTPREGGELITDGVFKFIRHPVYSAILFAAFGFAIYKVDFERMLFSLVLLLFFTWKANYEEEQLEQHFEGYRNYKLHTGRFLPYYRKTDSPVVDASVPTPEDQPANPAADESASTSTDS